MPFLCTVIGLPAGTSPALLFGNRRYVFVERIREAVFASADVTAPDLPYPDHGSVRPVATIGNAPQACPRLGRHPPDGVPVVREVQLILRSQLTHRIVAILLGAHNCQRMDVRERGQCADRTQVLIANNTCIFRQTLSLANPVRRGANTYP